MLNVVMMSVAVPPEGAEKYAKMFIPTSYSNFCFIISGANPIKAFTAVIYAFL
jgi:hypothetical protein